MAYKGDIASSRLEIRVKKAEIFDVQHHTQLYGEIEQKKD